MIIIYGVINYYRIPHYLQPIILVILSHSGKNSIGIHIYIFYFPTERHKILETEYAQVNKKYLCHTDIPVVLSQGQFSCHHRRHLAMSGNMIVTARGHLVTRSHHTGRCPTMNGMPFPLAHSNFPAPNVSSSIAEKPYNSPILVTESDFHSLSPKVP